MKKVGFLFVILLAFVCTLSCENEEITKLEKAAEVAESAELVSLEAFNENRAPNLKVDWETPLALEKDSTEFIEFQTTDFLNSDLYKVLGVTKKNSPTEYFVLMFLSSSDFDSDISYINDLKGFSGTINWFDLNGEIVALEAFEKGQRVNLTKSEDMEKTSALTLRSNDCGPGTAWTSDLNGKGKLVSKGNCNYGIYVTIIVTNWTDWYYDRGSLGMQYAYRSDFKRTYVKEWVSTGRDYANTSGGGSYVSFGNASTKNIITDVATVERILAEGLGHTSCRSFEYDRFGNTGTIVAGVEGIWDIVAKTDKCVGLGVVYAPNYYFSLPSHRYTTHNAKRASVIALEKAFKRVKTYFEKKPCKSQLRIGELALKLDQYLKSEFKKIGGAVSKYPPLDWDGEEQEYESNVGMERPDC